ncbi:hypothetical protein DAPPUDRAFT_333187 [Daphnia pulex]|uniref:Uncharacterized protein n=1 Tax=Daphnia pulex TaxID=6669 RepID=E9HS47_DAPPU|nr:hypothetical protein DAPPUDRAFT_333187 [Daphnia pulex]|eukprot:EFX65435.1 hypothetical protein DAPPUDRAFT_333187 [Daphnia pulex]
MDFPQDFVDFVDRVAVAEGWTDAQRIQIAARRLLKTALQWHIHTGHTHATWAAWSGAFTTNFSPRLHVGEWLRLVEERRQKVDESDIEYALDKHKLLRVAPIPLNDEKMVAFLIDGLASWQHVAAMTANRPANVPQFIQRIRELETLGIASRVVPPPAHGPVAPPWAPPVVPPVAPPAAPTTTPPVAPPSAPDLNATLAAFGNQLVNQLTAQFNKMAIGSRGAGSGGGGGDRGGRSGGDRGGGGWVDPNWIVKSKLSLIVEDGKIVLRSQDSNQPKVKKVRFAGIEEQNICSEEDDENDFFVSDELIDSLEAENKTKRCPRVIGTEVKVVESAVIPAESLCFVKAKISKKFTGNVIVRPNMCAHPGMEWIIPS